MTPEFLKKLANASLADVHVLGCVDDYDSPRRVYPQLRQVYLELDDQLLECSCVEDTGRMKIAVAAKLGIPSYLDGDFLPCAMSIRELVLADSEAANRVEGLKLWGASFQEDSVVCSAAELELENGQTLFFDPTYHFGFRIGGSQQRATWLQDWPEARSTHEWSLPEA